MDRAEWLVFIEKTYGSMPELLPEGEDAVRTPIDTETPENWARTWLDNIERVALNGLPAVYHGVLFDYVADVFAGDLPWTSPLYEQVWAAVQADPRRDRIGKLLLARFGEDLLAKKSEMEA